MKSFFSLLIVLFSATLTVTGQNIQVSTSSIDFETVYPGYLSGIQTYTVSGNSLNGDLIIYSPQGYEISDQCNGNYSHTLSISPSGGTVTSTTIYARFRPLSSGIFSGTISHQSTGAANQNINVDETTGTSNLPSSYYSNATSTGSALKSELHQLIDNHSVRSYSALWSDYQSTDLKPNGKVWDIYTDNGGCTTNTTEFTYGNEQCGNYASEGDCYNREHSFPKSWFNDASPMSTDLFHVIPSDGYTNGIRSNYPYGETDNPNYTSSNGSARGNNSFGPAYSANVFEPADQYKGDIARIYFYMATRYEDQIGSWEPNSVYGDVVLDGSSYPVFEQWYLDMLIEWHLQDPVSQKEIARNDAVYAIQGNRNPFVDHPEYALDIWGNELSVRPEPSQYPTTFEATADNTSAIHLLWTDAQGSIMPHGYMIQASDQNNFSPPADGDLPAEDTDLSDGSALVYVAQGVQHHTFSNLNNNQRYYFQIWPYTNSASNIDYKTSPMAPSDTATATGPSSITDNQNNNLIENLYFANNHLLIQTNSQHSLNIRLYRFNGQLIQTIQTNGQENIRINTEAFANELLILQVTDGITQKTYKLLSII